MLLRFDIFKPFDHLVHAVTTARFNDIDPFNLADHVGPNRQNAIEHRKLLCRTLDLTFEKLTTCQQIHKGSVMVVDRSCIGRGATGRASTLPDCDGLITDLTGVPLMTLAADCPLVLLYAPHPNTLAVVHASWRALVDGIIPNTIRLFVNHFSCREDTLLAGISPSAGPCCYEVGEDFRHTIITKTPWQQFIIRRQNRLRFDLWQACRHSLVESGLKSERIETPDNCTICDRRFFSYRRQGPHTGRFSLVAALR